MSDDTRGTPSNDALVAEMAALRAENVRLRGLLGLDERTSDGHAQAWAPTLLTEPTGKPSVDASSAAADKLALLWSLFGARSDVYARRWESASSGKFGWSPATKDRWSKGRRPRDYLRLSDDAFVSHLRGEETIGIYPLLRDDTCALLACDFDRGTWALDALAYLDACHRNAVPAALERSRSGNGAHVWVFFGAPVAASAARAMGAALLREAMTARAELDLASYDRFFPSQDFMPKAGFGNLIALPLQGASTAKGATVFLDPTTMEPWPDQWAFLSSVARMTPEAVRSLAETLRPVDTGPALSLAELASAGGPPPPPVVRARLGSELSIERAGLPPAVVAGLKHIGSIANPEFYEKQRMRFSTWDTPRFISAYREDLEWLHLPRGLTDQVQQQLDALASTLHLVDDRPEPSTAEFEFHGALRTQQQVAVADLVDHDLGVLVAPPGAGKTVMACAVIAHHDTPTLVVVDRKELVDQWRSRLQDHLGIESQEIGQIGGGRNEPTGIIDVAMIQSLARRDDPSLFDTYGLIVVDECHHIPAVSFTTCMRAARTRRWLGLTATPYRRDKLEALIAFQCGPTRHEIKPAAVDGATLLRRELIVHDTDASVTDDESAHIQEVFRLISTDEARTAQICRDVHDACSSGRTCLVLTQRTEHIDAIVTELAVHGDNALVLRGGLGKRARQAVTDSIASRDPDDGIILVATGSYLGEGFDWPELDTLFLAFRSRSRDESCNTSAGSYAPTKASTTSNSTTTSTAASVSSTACTPNGFPRTPPSVSTSPRTVADALSHQRSDRKIAMGPDDWLEDLDDPDLDLDEFVAQITVDAYGDEGYWSYRQALDDHIDLPVRATLVGVDVTVTEISFEDDRRGLTATVHLNGHTSIVSLLDLEIHDHATRARQLTQAYRRWVGLD